MYGGIVFINRQRRIVRRFLDAGATSSTSAKSIEQIGVHSSFAVERLIADGVLCHGDREHLYVDEKAWAALRMKRGLRIAGIVIFLAICYAAYFFVTRVL